MQHLALAMQRAVGERGAQEPPQLRVLLRIADDDVGVRRVVAVRGGGVLDELGLVAVAVDVLPGRALDERELVGRHAHHGAVLQVQRVDGLVRGALAHVRVEEEVVEKPGDDEENGLGADCLVVAFATRLFLVFNSLRRIQGASAPPTTRVQPFSIPPARQCLINPVPPRDSELQWEYASTNISPQYS
ncbi:hypothetical protein NUW58_g9618 [Xylaria curta]|uniref:Uncharacterized protein n=1 Tax=Xylaria curta TaxID=42375 RepID=A0ACC1MVL2_9PEZI|nr:hypothetical protein NUW58_g9618 [Xylaria curta]